ncbi:MAG TPA: hypothetical protein VKF80_08080 [Candidatus Eisenbacteria bacterium]|nr:hypothetical protein [Candidatus Eisenbacteria bacterium]
MTRRSVLLAVLLLAGCGSESTKPVEKQGLFIEPPRSVNQLISAYEKKDSTAYANFFTGDFTYEFSNATDPQLVTQYPGGWSGVDERASAGHLFHGLTKPGQETLPAASLIDIHFAVTIPVDDPGSADPVTHKLLVTRIDGQITIPPTELRPDPTDFLIDNNLNALYFVRGDSATGLGPNQPADSQHWYIYRWVDLTEANGNTSPAEGPVPTRPTTWGRLKADYR